MNLSGIPVESGELIDACVFEFIDRASRPFFLSHLSNSVVPITTVAQVFGIHVGMPPQHAHNAVAIIYDIGKSTSQSSIDDEITFFEESRDCISWILKRKIMSHSKDLVSLILTGTKNQDESLSDLNINFNGNVNVKYDFQLASWDMLYFIEKKVKTTENVSDWVGALAVAVHKLESLNESYNVGSKTVVIFSDLTYTFPEEVDSILEVINTLNIEINVIGSDRLSRKLEIEDEDEPSAKKLRQEPSAISSNGRANGEKLIYRIRDSIGDLMTICTFYSALKHLSSYSGKAVRPTPWNCILDIGDLKISIQMFKKTDRTSLPYKLKTVKNTIDLDYCDISDLQSSLTEVMRDKVMHYSCVDPTTLEHKEVIVDKDDIIDGFRYGTSIIPFSADDSSVLGYKPGAKCFSVLGFTPVGNVPLHLLTGECCYVVVPRAGDEKSEVALSAIIQAMSESGSVAIVRRVFSDNRGLTLGVLYPMTEEPEGEEQNHKECLIFIELAFEEDVKSVRLPSLKRIKRRITDDQYQAIDDLIDTMSLMKNDGDEEDYEEVDLKSRQKFKNQFFQDCIVQKALHPYKPLLTNLSDHYHEVIESQSMDAKARPLCKKLKEMFKKETETDTDSGAATAEKEVCDPSSVEFYAFSKGSSRTADSCFKKLFATFKYPTQEAILSLLKFSATDFGFSEEDTVKAFLRSTAELRQAALKNYTDDYNYWLRRLRINLGMEGQLERKYWKGIVEGNLGLITEQEHGESFTKKEDANFFVNSLSGSDDVSEEERKKDAEEEKAAMEMLF